VSEEHAQSFSPETPLFFLVDPLDGTKEFLKRNGEFTVNIALIRNGRPVAAVVGAPALDVMYVAGEGLGAVRRDAVGETSLRVPDRKSGEPLRVIGSRSHAAAEMEAWLRQLSEPHVFIAAGSSLKFCRVAEGAADIYPRFGPTSQWDTAAGQCVLEMAGGSVDTLDGAPFRYGLNRPMLNPPFIAVSNCKPTGYSSS
jgi:3'(2'), 5'-bisphosphate nucleotidase